MDYPSGEEFRWVREKGGWGISLQGEKGKVSVILSSTTYRGEVHNLPLQNTFGVPRTGTTIALERILAFLERAEADWARVRGSRVSTLSLHE